LLPPLQQVVQIGPAQELHIMRPFLPVVASLFAAGLLAAGTPSLRADAFTAYPNPTHPITTSSPVTYNGVNGVGITAYFYSVSAGDTDTISVWDDTQHAFLLPTNAFNNQSPSTPGTSVVFTNDSLTNGDVLYFDLFNTSYPTDTFSSNTATSPDGDNHAYITPFNGTIGSFGTIIGTYVGMEDLPNGASDWDYNDDTFVFTSVSATQRNITPTPEPSSFALLGTGLLGAAGFVRRRFVR
jgi:PEP-CTERM motif